MCTSHWNTVVTNPVWDTNHKPIKLVGTDISKDRWSGSRYDFGSTYGFITYDKTFPSTVDWDGD